MRRVPSSWRCLPLESEIRLDQTATERQPAMLEGEVQSATLPVTLEAEINELGMLMVSIVSADPAITACWPLEFNLRPVDRPGANQSPGAADAPLWQWMKKRCNWGRSLSEARQTIEKEDCQQAQEGRCSPRQVPAPAPIRSAGGNGPH